MPRPPVSRHGGAIAQGRAPARSAPRPDTRAPSFDLAAAIRSAQRAVASGGVPDRTDPDVVHQDPGFQRPPAAMAVVGINDRVIDLLDGEGLIGRVPPAEPAHRIETLRAAIFERSRVVQAGARLIEIVQPEGIPDAPVPAFYEAPTRFELIQPADFAPQVLVENTTTTFAKQDGIPNMEGTLNATAFPRIGADLDRATLTRRGVRFRFTRREMKDIGPAKVAALVMRSIAQGLARAVDHELLVTLNSALGVAAAPVENHFAAKGARFNELFGFIGTTTSGVVVEGELYFSFPQIRAELTDAVPDAIVAAWDRFAIAVEPEISILIERDEKGGLTFTCYCDMQSLVPDPDFAWRQTVAP